MRHFIALMLLGMFVAPANAQLAAQLFARDGESKLVHSVSDPLVLRMTLRNEEALRLTQLNQSNEATLIALKGSEGFAKLTDAQQQSIVANYSTAPIPSVTIDADTDWQRVIRLELRDSSDHSWSLTPTVMLANHSKENRVLDANNGLLFKLALSSADLAGLTSNLYHVVAVIGLPFKDKAEFYSNVLSFELIDPGSQENDEKSDEWYQSRVEYSLVTGNFADAKEWSLAWTAQHPATGDAWSALGDAEQGLKNREGAIAAYKQAELQFRAKHGNTPAEIPHLLIEKLSQARTLPANPNAQPQPPATPAAQ